MTTPNILLQTVPTNTLEPSIPVNDSLQALDALVRPGGIVQSRTVTTPPVTSSGDVGKRWIIPASATGAWAGKTGQIALSTAPGLWRYFAPAQGWRAYSVADNADVEYSGAGWALSAADAEFIRDTIGATLVAGTNITITPNDAGDTITISSSGGGGGGSATFLKARAHVAGSAYVNSGAWRKIPIDTATFDPAGIFDAVNGRFVPTTAGYYQCTVRVRAGGFGIVSATSIYRNGTLASVVGPDVNPSSAIAQGGTGLAYCNGIGDYLEPYVYAGGSGSLANGAIDTYMELVGPF